MMTYDQLLDLGQKAQRLQQIGQLQGHLLQTLRDPNAGFQLGQIPFTGEDSKRLRIGLVRLLEEMSQEGRMELEAHGVSFPPPPPPQPIEKQANGQAQPHVPAPETPEPRAAT